MKTEWTLDAENQLLITPNGATISLGQKALQIIPFSTVAVVLLEVEDRSNPTTRENVVAFSESGAISWKMAAPTLVEQKISRQPMNVFNAIVKEDDGTVILNDWLGPTLFVDAVSGKIVKKLSTR